MKKTLIVSALIMLLMVPLAAQQIVVISPGIGGVGGWCVGESQPILWETFGSMQATVTITLRYANSAPTAEPALYIATGEANDGSYSWTIPGTVAPGDYFLRVRTDDMSVIGDGKVFMITTRSAIIVERPRLGDEFCIGKNPLIKWTKFCAMQDTVTIALRKEGSLPDAAPACVIKAGAVNNGFYYQWTIPDDIAPGNYFIRVRTDDMSVIGDGGVFTIKECNPSIRLRTPDGGEKWGSGSDQMISWEKSGWSGRVKLILMQNGKFKGTIARNWPVTPPTFHWKAGMLDSGKTVVPGAGFRIRVVRDYPGPWFPKQPLMDESDGDFAILFKILEHGPASSPD